MGDTVALLLERIRTAVDISSALAYLHSKGIIHRDLKPGNVGFDRNGTVKLFDFGLAVEVPEPDDQKRLHELSGNTGTARYMAPEVIRKEKYNFKVDMFSFAVLLWEIMSLSKPYDGLSGPQVKEFITVFGDRLNIPWSWPKGIKQVVKQGWSKRVEDRPTMGEAQSMLSKVQVELKAKHAKLLSTGRFSTKSNIPERSRPERRRTAVC